jgi:uncharacterized membrane protein YkoI
MGAAHPTRGGLIACALIACALALLPVGAALADGEENVRAEPELTRVQATEIVQKRYGARVVRASETDEGGRHLYVFKLLSDAGKVWIVRVDAHSGAEVP